MRYFWPTLFAVSLTFGVWISGQSPKESVGNGVHVPERRFGLEIAAGASAVVRIPIRNTGEMPQRVVGIRTDCNCTKPIELPFTVPPHETVEVPIEVHASEHDVGESTTVQIIIYFEFGAAVPVEVRIQNPAHVGL